MMQQLTKYSTAVLVGLDISSHHSEYSGLSAKYSCE